MHGLAVRLIGLLLALAVLLPLPSLAQNDVTRVQLVERAIADGLERSERLYTEKAELADWIDVERLHALMRDPEVVPKRTTTKRLQIVALSAGSTYCKQGRTIQWDDTLGNGFATVSLCPRFFELDSDAKAQMAIIAFGQAMKQSADCSSVSYGFWISYLDVGHYDFRPAYWKEHGCERQKF